MSHLPSLSLANNYTYSFDIRQNKIYNIFTQLSNTYQGNVPQGDF
jgi:hypothetical protein